MYSKGTRGNKQSSEWRFDCVLSPRVTFSGCFFVETTGRKKREREEEEDVSRLDGVKSISRASFTANIK